MSLRSVLRCLRGWLVLCAGMLQWFRVALGSSDALRLSGVPLPCLASLGMVDSLSDVRRRIQVTMVRDATGGAARLRVVAHVKVGLADVTLPGRVRRVYSQYSPSVGLNHVTSTPVHLTTEPATELHRIADVGQVLKHHQGIVSPPGRVSNLLSNKDTQFLTPVRQVGPVMNRLLILALSL